MCYFSVLLCVPVAPVNKRSKQKAKAPNRPKSQPPSSLQHGDKVASSHSSQEDLRPRGRSPATDRHRKGLSVHGKCYHGDKGASAHSSQEDLQAAGQEPCH